MLSAVTLGHALFVLNDFGPSIRGWQRVLTAERSLELRVVWARGAAGRGADPRRGRHRAAALREGLDHPEPGPGVVPGLGASPLSVPRPGRDDAVLNRYATTSVIEAALAAIAR